MSAPAPHRHRAAIAPAASLYRDRRADWRRQDDAGAPARRTLVNAHLVRAPAGESVSRAVLSRQRRVTRCPRNCSSRCSACNRRRRSRRRLSGTPGHAAPRAAHHGFHHREDRPVRASHATRRRIASCSVNSQSVLIPPRPAPDLVVYLQASPEVLFARIQKRAAADGTANSRRVSARPLRRL